MKTRLAMTALAVSLLATAGLASAQETYYRTAQVPGQASADTWTQSGGMQQGASMQSQGDTSYGGAPATRTATGSTNSMGGISKPCTRGPQCDIFFGN